MISDIDNRIFFCAKIKKDISSMPCSLVSAPPTLNTMTATHAIQPILSIYENDYKSKVIIKIFCLFLLLYLTCLP